MEDIERDFMQLMGRLMFEGRNTMSPETRAVIDKWEDKYWEWAKTKVEEVTINANKTD